MTAIRPARWPDDLPVVRGLFVEYAQGLGFDLDFQDFDAELDPYVFNPIPGAMFLGRVLPAAPSAKRK